MSLTTLIRKDCNLYNILTKTMPKKEEFYANSGKPAFYENYKYKVIGTKNTTGLSRERLIGISFDYMARFMIDCKCCDKNSIKSISAGKGIDRLSVCQSQYLISTLRHKLEHSIDAIRKYIENGVVKEYANIIDESYFLAMLDVIPEGVTEKPTRYYKYLSSTLDTEIREEIEKLCKLFYTNFIEGMNYIKEDENKVVYAPKFTESGIIVGGAIADLFVNGILIDFKSGKHIGYNPDEVAQIWGYYLLYLLEKERGSKSDIAKEEVSRIGIYRARVGVTELCDIERVSESRVEEALTELRKYNIRGAKII